MRANTTVVDGVSFAEFLDTVQFLNGDVEVVAGIPERFKNVLSTNLTDLKLRTHSASDDGTVYRTFRLFLRKTSLLLLAVLRNGGNTVSLCS